MTKQFLKRGGEPNGWCAVTVRVRAIHCSFAGPIQHNKYQPLKRSTVHGYPPLDLTEWCWDGAGVFIRFDHKQMSSELVSVKSAVMAGLVAVAGYLAYQYYYEYKPPIE